MKLELNNRSIYILICILNTVLFLSCQNDKSKVVSKASKPNIIYILADDLGYGDLSSYGQEKFQTPNIDRLAERGIKFSEHYSGSTVCAPSRSSLMTGQHTGHTPIRGNKEIKGREGQTPMPAGSVTIAEILKGAGYSTGAFGKWGLGYIGSEGDPINQGFDTFYGYNCQRQAHRYYPTHLWKNDKKEMLEGNNLTNIVTYAPDKIQEETLKFLEDNKDKPFFAYVPLVLPHAELISPNDSLLQKYIGKYDEVPYKNGSDYGKDIVEAKYCNTETPYAAFASMVDRMDIYVGQIITKVKELGIENNTIIMFASDNGPHAAGGASPEYFNSAGGLKGIKRDLYEGGIRSPFIVVWPKKIKPGITTNHISAFWDVMPTVSEIANIDTPTNTDGISFLPTLLGQEKQEQHTYLYWEFNHKGGRQAVRKGKWKGILYNAIKDPKAKLELYDLYTDATESKNVADENPEIVAEIEQIIKESHVDSELFPFKLKSI
ncbi:arylsulfatase A-like enzyme [Maribacter vaceletii]|uniref:Arylsulfatase A-like enzyme n=1 Tax=Maribacter vaceletii TaxID=1206816 RepID=A0A495E5E6_9FLAO|nr:arylsulfatase [Maribacter vaceletii]RKR12164.1 arylsulfatase A-like enzyme [Maribacter vaceletii]